MTEITAQDAAEKAPAEDAVDPEEAPAENPIGEVLEGLPLDEEEKATVTRRLELLRGHFSSPVPPPFIMKEHGEVLPSAPERILAMAERQSAHRQMLENRVTRGADIRAYTGQGCALLVALLFGYWSYDLIRTGAEWPGALLGTVDLVGLVSVFMLGKRGQERDRRRDVAPPSRNPSPDDEE